jgi:hypothetical protein
MEMFLFKSQGSANAITLDPKGKALPPTPGGWAAFGSMGDLSFAFDQAAIERLRTEGFLLFDKEQPPSQNAGDWQPMPRGSFRLTDKAAEQLRRTYEDMNRRS